MRSKALALVAISGALASGTLLAAPAATPPATPPAPAAPELTGGRGWLNAASAPTLSAMRGKAVLLHFWTYGRIGALETLPDLRKLAARFPEKLAVIGVHSGESAQEGETENVRQAVLRHEVTHPVLNDADKAVWNAYGARVWPTLVVIDPQGRVAGRFEGPGHYQELFNLIATLPDATPAPQASPRKLERDAFRDPRLAFPGKVLAEPDGRRLFIADTGHHRILICDRRGKVSDVVGSGARGLLNASFSEAQFDHPQGLALDGDTLYVADAGNHAVRSVSLKTRQVSTALEDPRVRSPWDLALARGTLYIAAAGTHRLFAADLKTRRAYPFIGTGEEGAADGLGPVARLAQPTGLAVLGDVLYVADSAAGSIRAISLSAPAVKTLLSPGLAGLRHPLGLAASATTLFIADAFNGQIKALDPLTLAVKTVAAGLREPGGLTLFEGGLLVADTGRHALRRLSLDGKDLGALPLTRTPDFPPGPPMADLPEREETTLGPLPVIAATPAAVMLSWELPTGYHLNPRAPLRYRIAETRGPLVFVPETRRAVLMRPKPPLTLRFTAAPGRSEALLDVDLYYCRADEAGPCLTAAKRYRLILDAATDSPIKEVPVLAKP